VHRCWFDPPLTHLDSPFVYTQGGTRTPFFPHRPMCNIFCICIDFFSDVKTWLYCGGGCDLAGNIFSSHFLVISFGSEVD
jgi:hypothetical protein